MASQARVTLRNTFQVQSLGRYRSSSARTTLPTGAGRRPPSGRRARPPVADRGPFRSPGAETRACRGAAEASPCGCRRPRSAGCRDGAGTGVGKDRFVRRSSKSRPGTRPWVAALAASSATISGGAVGDLAAVGEAPLMELVDGETAGEAGTEAGRAEAHGEHTYGNRGLGSPGGCLDWHALHGGARRAAVARVSALRSSYGASAYERKGWTAAITDRNHERVVRGARQTHGRWPAMAGKAGNSEPETTDSLRAFGAVVKAFRGRATLTQEGLARRVRILRGDRRLDRAGAPAPAPGVHRAGRAGAGLLRGAAGDGARSWRGSRD